MALRFAASSSFKNNRASLRRRLLPLDRHLIIEAMTNPPACDAKSRMENDLTSLVSAARGGDGRSFDLIVRRFQDMAVGYAETILAVFRSMEPAVGCHAATALRFAVWLAGKED